MDHDPYETSQEAKKDEFRKADDLGGRRRKADRRGRTTAGIFPERRWLRHRREGGDRRSFPFFGPRRNRERREAFRETEPEDNS